jgi:type II secretory ATPase GspE/PulE/Tfp pilus assembly ATPase PilB-like protein
LIRRQPPLPQQPQRLGEGELHQPGVVNEARPVGAARRHGMRNLREDGWRKVAAGVTTADEVMRVTQEF